MQQSLRFRQRLALADVAMGADGLDDLVADGENRIERGHRVLEDHRGGSAADLRQRVLVGGEDVDAVERQGLGRDLRRGRKEPHQRKAGHRFSGAGLADDADALAFVDVKADAAHRFDDTAVLGKLDL